MTGPRDAEDDVVEWVIDLFEGLLRDYAKNGAPAGPVSAEQLQRLLALLPRAEADWRSTWGGERPYICRVGWRTVAQRNESIRRDRAAGTSLAQLSLQYSLSVTGVRRICGEAAR